MVLTSGRVLPLNRITGIFLEPVDWIKSAMFILIIVIENSLCIDFLHINTFCPRHGQIKNEI